MNINKEELFLMMCNYWALDNNPTCEEATKIFLRRHNLLNEFTTRFKELNEHVDDLSVDELDELETEYLEASQG